MFKTISTVALLQLVNAEITSEFMSGAQTGIFLSSEEEFVDYSCPEPEMSAQVENYINMYNSAKMMMGITTKNKKVKAGEPEPEVNPMAAFFAKIDLFKDQVGTIMSVMDESYEGGDFCSGLTVAFEVRRVGMQVVQSVITNMFNREDPSVDQLQ